MLQTDKTSLLQAEIAASRDYKDLDEKAWLEKIAYRGITRNSQKDIDRWKPMYTAKIAAIREELANGIQVDTHRPLSKAEYAAAYDEREAYLREKEKRLLDKLACVLKEEELRKTGAVTRENVHDQGVYYIDFTNGNDTNDGLAADNDHAWKTINQYTTETVRTPGDIAYVRANMTLTQDAANIIFDEDGDVNAWIKIIGCDATINDPWNDDSDVQPVIDFADKNYYTAISSDKYWWLENLWIKQSAYSAGTVVIGGGSSTLGLARFVNCTISDGAAYNVEGITVESTSVCYLEGCTFIDTYGNSVYNDGIIYMNGCTLNAGTTSPASFGLSNSGVAFVSNCSFGDTSAFNSGAIQPAAGAIYLRNCSYSGTLLYLAEMTTGMVYFEDDDAVFGAHAARLYAGVISRETASPRSGGATSYARMTPSESYCGSISPLILGHPLNGFAQVWLSAADASTITVYIRGADWTTAPGNSTGQSTCYLKASYLSNAATAARTEILSAQDVANDDTTWTAFTVTIPATYPKRDGFVYLWVYLGAYQASKYIDVDIKPVIS